MHEDQTPQSSLTLFATKLTERQKAALPYLLEPGPITQRARQAGIHRGTLYRWMRDDAFKEAIDSLKQQVFRLVETELQSMAHEAASVIYEAMQNDNTRTRLSAALATLEFAQKASYGRELPRRPEKAIDAMQL